MGVGEACQIRRPKAFPKRWADQTVAVIATGKSLSGGQCERIREAGYRTIAVSNAPQLAGPCDVLYSADGEWWEEWLAKNPGYHELNECWTQSVYASYRFGINYIASIDLPGFSLDPTAVHMGGNSGYQALNLAVLSGSKNIRLYGFDMKDSGHFFGSHPSTLRKTESHRFRHWVHSLNAASIHARELGIKIINCTPGSALRCFEFCDD